jgi:hypothetical protein
MTAKGTDIPTLPLTELADRHSRLTSEIAAVVEFKVGLRIVQPVN